jgi:hypothetical protein
MKPAALLLGLAVLAAGCGDSKTNPVIPPAGLPANSSPAGALARFEAAYEQRKLAEYGALFTADFSFIFSSQADPLLAQQYGTSWGADDEAASAGHLFAGFTSTEPPFETFPGASDIQLALVGVQNLPDIDDHPDSTTHYRLLVVPQVELTITVASAGDPLVYEIDAPHDFRLVRGDVALLSAGQPADSLHWYIRRWDDRTPFTGSARSPVRSEPQRAMPAAPASWGRVKGQYR